MLLAVRVMFRKDNMLFAAEISKIMDKDKDVQKWYTDLQNPPSPDVAQEDRLCTVREVLQRAEDDEDDEESQGILSEDDPDPDGGRDYRFARICETNIISSCSVDEATDLAAREANVQAILDSFDQSCQIVAWSSSSSTTMPSSGASASSASASSSSSSSSSSHFDDPFASPKKPKRAKKTVKK